MRQRISAKRLIFAVKQLEDIEYIREMAGLDSLPDNLKEMALLRLEHPEAPLGELGTYLNPCGREIWGESQTAENQ